MQCHDLMSRWLKELRTEYYRPGQPAYWRCYYLASFISRIDQERPHLKLLSTTQKHEVRTILDTCRKQGFDTDVNMHVVVPKKTDKNDQERIYDLNDLKWREHLKVNRDGLCLLPGARPAGKTCPLGYSFVHDYRAGKTCCVPLMTMFEERQMILYQTVQDLSPELKLEAESTISWRQVTSNLTVDQLADRTALFQTAQIPPDEQPTFDSIRLQLMNNKKASLDKAVAAGDNEAAAHIMGLETPDLWTALAAQFGVDQAYQRLIQSDQRTFWIIYYMVRLITTILCLVTQAANWQEAMFDLLMRAFGPEAYLIYNFVKDGARAAQHASTIAFLVIVQGIWKLMRYFNIGTSFLNLLASAFSAIMGCTVTVEYILDFIFLLGIQTEWSKTGWTQIAVISSGALLKLLDLYRVFRFSEPQSLYDPKHQAKSKLALAVQNTTSIEHTCAELTSGFWQGLSALPRAIMVKLVSIFCDMFSFMKGFCNMTAKALSYLSPILSLVGGALQSFMTLLRLGRVGKQLLVAMDSFDSWRNQKPPSDKEKEKEKDGQEDKKHHYAKNYDPNELVFNWWRQTAFAKLFETDYVFFLNTVGNDMGAREALEKLTNDELREMKMEFDEKWKNKTKELDDPHFKSKIAEDIKASASSKIELRAQYESNQEWKQAVFPFGVIRLQDGLKSFVISNPGYKSVYVGQNKYIVLDKGGHEIFQIQYYKGNQQVTISYDKNLESNPIVSRLSHELGMFTKKELTSYIPSPDKPMYPNVAEPRFIPHGVEGIIHTSLKSNVYGNDHAWENVGIYVLPDHMYIIRDDKPVIDIAVKQEDSFTKVNVKFVSTEYKLADELYTYLNTHRGHHMVGRDASPFDMLDAKVSRQQMSKIHVIRPADNIYHSTGPDFPPPKNTSGPTGSSGPSGPSEPPGASGPSGPSEPPGSSGGPTGNFGQTNNSSRAGDSGGPTGNFGQTNNSSRSGDSGGPTGNSGQTNNSSGSGASGGSTRFKNSSWSKGGSSKFNNSSWSNSGSPKFNNSSWSSGGSSKFNNSSWSNSGSSNFNNSSSSANETEDDDNHDNPNEENNQSTGFSDPYGQTSRPITATEINNAFHVLNLDPNSSLSDVYANYRKLAKQYHPDKGGEKYHSKMIELNLAYEILKTVLQPKNPG